MCHCGLFLQILQAFLGGILCTFQGLENANLKSPFKITQRVSGRGGIRAQRLQGSCFFLLCGGCIGDHEWPGINAFFAHTLEQPALTVCLMPWFPDAVLSVIWMFHLPNFTLQLLRNSWISKAVETQPTSLHSFLGKQKDFKATLRAWWNLKSMRYKGRPRVWMCVFLKWAQELGAAVVAAWGKKWIVFIHSGSSPARKVGWERKVLSLKDDSHLDLSWYCLACQNSVSVEPGQQNANTGATGTDEIPTVKRLKNTRNIIKDIAQMGILIIWSKFLKPSGLTSPYVKWGYDRTLSPQDQLSLCSSKHLEMFKLNFMATYVCRIFQAMPQALGR